MKEFMTNIISLESKKEKLKYLQNIISKSSYPCMRENQNDVSMMGTI